MRPFLSKSFDLSVEDDHDDDESVDLDDDESGWAERVLSKKRRIEGPPSQYMPTSWIPNGTCEVERLFSKCKHIFSQFRKAMTPATMEILLYLKVNRQHWDQDMVATIVQGNNDDDLLNDDDDDDDFPSNLSFLVNDCLLSICTSTSTAVIRLILL